MIRKVFFRSFILLFFVFSSCIKKKAQPTPVTNTPTTTPTTTVVVNACESVTFTKDIKAIVDANCVNCHNETFTGANFKVYAELKSKATDGKLKSYTIDGQPSIMPKGGNKLPQSQLDLILCWINNGAKQ